jgi:hypothetical protein
MRYRGGMLFFLLSFFMLPALRTEAARIFSVEGDVKVRQEASGDWKAAAVGQEVLVQAEIQAESGAQCTVIFNENKNRLAVVNENSTVRVEELDPDEIFLLQGRVFSLVKKEARGTDFRVRTPTAISGARGTAWAVACDGTRTSVSCFEDAVFVAGLSASGEPTGEQDVSFGFGVSIDEKGVLGEIISLSEGEILEGQRIQQMLERVSGPMETPPAMEAKIEAVAQDSVSLAADPSEAALADGSSPMENFAAISGVDMGQISGEGNTAIGPASDSSPVQEIIQQVQDQTHDQGVLDDQTPANSDGSGTVVTPN